MNNDSKLLKLLNHYYICPLSKRPIDYAYGMLFGAHGELTRIRDYLLFMGYTTQPEQDYSHENENHHECSMMLGFGCYEELSKLDETHE